MAGSRFSPISSASSLLVLFLLFGFSAAAMDILVGGRIDAWKIPTSESDSLNKWAEKARFQVGDHLVWKYEQGKDSVLQVTEEDYKSCNTKNPIREHKEGMTKVRLDNPGPYYFISGENGHCEKGEKVLVIVMTPRGRSAGGIISRISPSPSPSVYIPATPSPSVYIPATAPSPSSDGSALKFGVFVMILGFWVNFMI